jgi:intein/homing endonuclease
MAWWDFFKIFTFAFRDDPIAEKDRRTIMGPGVTQPDAMPDLRAMADGSTGGGTAVRLRDSNDFVDLSTVTNRMHRYKEYERLRSMAEIEMALTVFADEACMAGDTQVIMPAYENGACTLEWLVKNNTAQKFLVYAFDKDKGDFTLAWGYDPRLVGEKDTFKVLMDDGSSFVATFDHQVLMRDETWRPMGELHMGDMLMPFYRLPPRLPPHQYFSTRKIGQYPRIRSLLKGWITERQLVDEWRTGKDNPKKEKLNRNCRMIASGLTVRQMQKITGCDFNTMKDSLRRAGFTNSEMKWLGKKEDYRRVIGIVSHGKIPVYDMSVEKHACLCTNWGVVHNCQRDENGRVLQVTCKDEAVTEELEFLLFHRKMLNLDQKKVWNRAKNLFAMGDDFWEIIIDPENPKGGVIDLQFLPPDSMYRIETTKGKIVEFQQSKEGPDYQSLSRVDVTQSTEADLMQATAIRFAPEQIIHVKIGDERKTFYPYGISLIEAARGPAHQLRMMEDAMVVYRLCVTSYVKIKTSTGWKFMKDIEPGDHVFTFDKSSKLVYAEVMNHINNGLRKVFKVSSRHSQITGTETHPVLTCDKKTGIVGYVDIKDLIPNRHQFVMPVDQVDISKKIDRFYTDRYARLSYEQKVAYKTNEYPEGKKNLVIRCLESFGEEVTKKSIQKVWCFLVSEDNLSLPLERARVVCNIFNLNPDKLVEHNKKERTPLRIDLPECVDEDFAELLGFLYGDGGVSYHRASGKVWFASGEIPRLNKKYCDLLTRYFGSCSYYQDKRKKDGIGIYCVNSITACDIFSNLGLNGDCYTKRIPPWVFQASKSIRHAFVKGFADADGEKRGMGMSRWNTTIRLANRLLVEDIQQLWRSVGYHASEVKRIEEPERFINEVKIADEGESWQLYISEVEVPLYDEILTIEPAGEEEVFDLTVDHEEHNFVANNVVIHNTRAPERRVFYIDVQQLPPAKAEAFVERMKDQFKKRKSPKNNSPEGASSVEERWHAPAADEDFWIPIRPNANTRVETLPGAQNLGEIDDTVYFRNKLFIALNFPKNYFNNEDAQVSRVSLSAQDIKFARMIERLQSHMEDAFWELCDRHLRLRGFPEESYEDLKIVMTPPSDWRELTRQEIVSGRIQNAGSLKGSQLLSDFDVLTKWMKYPEDEAKIMLARNKLQKLEELKFQVIAQNPTLAGVGLPPDDESQVGSEPSPDNPMLGGEPPPPPDMGAGADMGGAPASPASGGGKNAITAFPEPSDDDVHKYDMEINDFASEQDEEEIDQTEIP